MSKSLRVQEIFLKATQLKASERAPFLDRECGSNTELKSQVEQLLNHHFSKTILPQASDTVQTRGERPRLRNILNSLTTRTISRQFTPERRRGILAAMVMLVLLAAALVIVHRLVRQRIAYEMKTGMSVIADRQVYGVRYWLQAQEQFIRTWARQSLVVESLRGLNDISRSTTEAPATDSGNRESLQLQSQELHGKLLQTLDHLNTDGQTPRFAAWNLEGVLIADSTDPGQIGNRVTEYGASLLVKVFHGETTFWFPTRKGLITRRDGDAPFEDISEMAVITPVNDEQGKAVAAVLVSGIGLADRFDQLVAGIHFGESGETYAFDQEGYLLSVTRFLPEFDRLGLLTAEHQWEYWNVRVTDPGVDLTEGQRTDIDRAEWPLTRMAAAATAGRDGEDLDGYRDYRGRPVIGVWRWLPDYQFGIVVEVDVVNAYASLNYIWWAFAGLLGTTLIVPTVITWTAIQNSLSRAELPGTLGVYTLGDKIGEGGIGEVYRAEHTLLKRPTAVKVLKPEQMTEAARIRFEREVRLAAQLDHPNTIEIYDYGEDTNGRLYYAMEYVDGLTLSQLIHKTGTLPAERAVAILRQVCLSLREAHARGLVHRDIKPQNIMVCCRGGEADVVKVLDFGLVKQFELSDSASVTNSGMLVGTPMYISPERLRDPTINDPQSDIYSLGVVAFEMLSGCTPYAEGDPASILHDTIFNAPKDLKMLTKNDVPRELLQLVMSCLNKSSEQRPKSVDEMIDLLDAIPLRDPWKQERARTWWIKYGTPDQVRSLPRLGNDSHLSETCPG